MHSMHSSGGVELSRTGASKFGAAIKSSVVGATAKTSITGAITKMSSMLATVIDMEVAETAANFLTIYQDICLHNGLYFSSGNT